MNHGVESEIGPDRSLLVKRHQRDGTETIKGFG